MKVFPKGTPDWNKFDHCILAISLESPNHFGEALKSIIDFINNSNYKFCTVDLSDVLYRHTYMINGENEQSAYTHALQAGDIWLAKEMSTLQKIKIPYVIKRWKEWLNHPSYPTYRSQFEKAFQNYLPFRQAIMKDVEGFFIRRRRSRPVLETPENIRRCAAYLLEELTCHSVMHDVLPRSANLYPGRELSCYKLVRAGLVPDVPTGLQNSYFVRLNLWHSTNIDDKQNASIEEKIYDFEIKKLRRSH
jgi:tRNA-dependent cyclodipeptide synthase